MTTEIKLFEEQRIRSHWDGASEEWYFSVVDVVEVLTGSVNPRDYWVVMKKRVQLDDGFQLPTICRQLKLISSDGKKYLTDCANAQGLLRIIQIQPQRGSASKTRVACIHATLDAQRITSSTPTGLYIQT
jgi:hypothetical protein